MIRMLLNFYYRLKNYTITSIIIVYNIVYI